MEMHQIRYFLVVAETLNFTRASITRRTHESSSTTFNARCACSKLNRYA